MQTVKNITFEKNLKLDNKSNNKLFDKKPKINNKKINEFYDEYSYSNLK